MRRGVSTLVIVVALAGLAGSAWPGPVSAQDGDASGANPTGSPITIYDTGGLEDAQVTVTKVVDPFAVDATNSGLTGGERFVLAMIVVANTGEYHFGVTPSGFSVLDGHGRVTRASVTPRTKALLAGYPHLATAVITPGQTVTGAVLFRMADDAVLVRLSYTHAAGTTRRYVLADLTGPTHGAGSRAIDVAGCAWMEGTLGRLNALAPAGVELQGMDDDPDPDRLRQISAALAAAAGEQRDSGPPAVADEANGQIADALDTYADALDTYAGALDAIALSLIHISEPTRPY